MKKIVSLYKDDFYKNKGEEFYQIAMQKITLQQYEEAVEDFKSACQFDHENAKYHFYAGVSLYLTNELNQASEYLERAKELEPKNSEYKHTYGVVLYRMKKFEEAKEVFKEVLEFEDYVESMLYYGKSANELQEFDEAIHSLKKAEEFESKSEALFELGCSYLGKYELEKAKFYFLKTIKEDKGHIISYYYLSKVYLKQGKHEESLELLKQLKENHPGEAELVDKNMKIIHALKEIK